MVTASTGDCVSDADPATKRPITNFVQVADYYEVTVEAEIGTRTLVGSLSRGGLGCYDWVTRAPCTGGDFGGDGWISQTDTGGGLPSAYGAVSDGACAIALGDPGRVFTVDPAGTSPCTSLGSGTDRTTIDLRDQRCDGTVGAATWRNVVLTDTNSDEMESTVVTIRDARTGQVLKSGEMIGGDQTLDLSGVNTAEHPSITVDATAKSKSGNAAWDDGIPPRIRVNWKSDPQTACLQTTGDNACGSSPADVLKGTRVYHPCTKKRPGRGFRF